VQRLLGPSGLPVRLRQVEEERGVVLVVVGGLELPDRLVVAAEVVERRAALVVLLRGGLVLLVGILLGPGGHRRGERDHARDGGGQASKPDRHEARHYPPNPGPNEAEQLTSCR
jgi:hypothetical protein